MLTITDYIEQHSSQESSVLSAINHDTHLHVVNPHMLSGHIQGRLLSLLSQMINPTRILELGTYTGYSALCLAEGLNTHRQESSEHHPEARLITIEKNDELEDLIRHNLSLSPLGQLINPLIGDAKQIIPTLPDDFDLVFIDADKREYCAYFDLIYSHVRAGGFILADNTLWDGHVIDPSYDRDAQTKGLRAFNDRIAADTRLEKVILPIRDGLTIIRKLE